MVGYGKIWEDMGARQLPGTRPVGTAVGGMPEGHPWWDAAPQPIRKCIWCMGCKKREVLGMIIIYWNDGIKGREHRTKFLRELLGRGK
jgi:hypothetical protein